MSENLKETIKWHRRGGFILLSLLAISLTVIWSGVLGIPDEGLLGASMISITVFGAIGVTCLVKARIFRKQMEKQNHE